MHKPLPKDCGGLGDRLLCLSKRLPRDRDLELKTLGCKSHRGFQERLGILVVLPPVRPYDARTLAAARSHCVERSRIEGWRQHLGLRRDALDHAPRTVVGKLAKKARDLREEPVEVVSGVEETPVGCEGARDVGERELVVPLGGVAVGVVPPFRAAAYAGSRAVK